VSIDAGGFLMTTIVALGDSTTAGTPGFSSPLEAPPDGSGNPESQYAYWLVRGNPDWRVLNRGVNGERTDQIGRRFNRDVVLTRADVVIIVAGVNDIYQSRTAEAVQTGLLAIYRAARDAAIPAVAGSILPYNTATPEQNARMRAVNTWIRDVASREVGAVFCDTRAAVAMPGRPDLLASSPDDIHPSPAGYRLMAVALEPAVKAALAAAHPLR
jgi:lysophospholipase L1-like esterase